MMSLTWRKVDAEFSGRSEMPEDDVGKWARTARPNRLVIPGLVVGRGEGKDDLRTVGAPSRQPCHAHGARSGAYVPMAKRQ
jgi:hypothetical protein